MQIGKQKQKNYTNKVDHCRGNQTVYCIADVFRIALPIRSHDEHEHGTTGNSNTAAKQENNRKHKVNKLDTPLTDDEGMWEEVFNNHIDSKPYGMYL